MTQTSTATATCKDLVKRTTGRNEFQSRTALIPCGREVAEGRSRCQRCIDRSDTSMAAARERQALATRLAAARRK